MHGLLLDDLDQPLTAKPITVSVEIDGALHRYQLQTDDEGAFGLSERLPGDRHRVQVRFAGETLYAGTEDTQVVARSQPDTGETREAPRQAVLAKKAEAGNSISVLWALLPLLLSGGVLWLTARRTQRGADGHRPRSRLGNAPVGIAPRDLREAAWLAFMPAALRVLPPGAHWRQFTLRETLEAARARGRDSEALSSLTGRTEALVYAASPPTPSEVAAIEEEARDLAERSPISDLAAR